MNRVTGHSWQAMSQVEVQFKVLWANHGDDISLQYAGTGALKSGFTRTGQRTTGRCSPLCAITWRNTLQRGVPTKYAQAGCWTTGGNR